MNYLLLFILSCLTETCLTWSLSNNVTNKKCPGLLLGNFLLIKIAKNGKFSPPARSFHPTRLFDTLEYIKMVYACMCNYYLCHLSKIRDGTSPRIRACTLPISLEMCKNPHCLFSLIFHFTFTKNFKIKAK